MKAMKLVQCIAFGISSFGAFSGAFGAINASDNAADVAYSSGWPNGSNGGIGFGPWSLNVTGSAGVFIGDATSNGGSGSGNPGESGGAINTSNKSFGMFASGGTASAVRPFTASMVGGQVFSADMDNGQTATSPSPSFGIGLQNSTSENRFTLVLQGASGANSDYLFQDATGNHDTGLDRTSSGVHLSVAITGTDAYTATLSRYTIGDSFTFSGTLAGSLGTGMNRAILFDNNAGIQGANSVFFNNLSVAPEPNTFAILCVGLTALIGRRRRNIL
jgi:hypothetical protein